MHALSLHRLDEEDGDVLAAQLALERVEVAERHPANPGRSGPKRLVNSAFPFAEREPSVSPWKACSSETTRGRPVAARPSFSAASTASVPLLVKSTRSSRVAACARSSASARSGGSGEAPSCTPPGRSSSSASTSAARTRGLLRPTLNIPKPPSMSR